MPEIASVNGKVTPIGEACIGVNDRGLLFGDSVYEVIASYEGRLFLFREHMDRLRRSLDAVKMDYVDVGPIAQQIQSLYQQAGISRAKVYLQITRGEAPRDHAFPSPRANPNIIITVREVHDGPEDWLNEGISCITQRDIRWGRVDIKTTNLLPNCLAKQAALDQGVLEAIFVSDDGIVREGTSSNLFIVKDKTVWTHPRGERILPGITRQSILEVARQTNLEIREETFSGEFMMAADEVFLSGTTAEIVPVVNIDGQPIADGKPGPITKQLYKDLLAWIKAGLENGE